MLATPKSRRAFTGNTVWLVWLLAAWLSLSARSEGNAAFAAHAEKVFEDAKARMAAEPTNAEAKWKFAKACFDWADYATADARREEIARQGIEASRSLTNLSPNSAPGHYFLAMNLGQMAESKTVGALSIIPQMEAHFKIASAYDPMFDYAGPERNLGVLYLQAPGWPLSIGNHTQAKIHLEKAAQLVPDYPGNLLYLIEAEIGWGEKSAALKNLKLLDEIWPQAKKKFPGEDFAADWADWEKRRAEARKKLETSPKPVASPRGETDK
jgi:hypothetical protein